MRWRQVLLDVSVLVMEGAWLFAAGTILSMFFGTRGERLPLVAVMACYVLSFYVGRALGRFRLPLGVLRGVEVLFGLLTVVALLALNFGGYRPSSLVGAGAGAPEGLHLGRAEVAGLIVLVGTWWRGGQRGQVPADFDVVFRSFRVGLFVTMAALLGDAAQQGVYASRVAVLPFFLGALLGFTLGHLKRVDESGEQPVPQAWITMLAAMVAGLLLLSALFGLVPRSWFLYLLRPAIALLEWFADTVLMTFLLALGYVAEFLINIGRWLVSLFYREREPSPEDLERMRRDFMRYREQVEGGQLLPGWLQTLGEWLIILAVAALVVWLFVRVIRRRWLVPRREEGERRDSVWEAGALGAELSAVVSAIAGRFRRRPVARWRGLDAMGRAERRRFLALAGMYYGMLELARSQGRERPEGQTPFEFLSRLADLPLAPQAARITEAFVRARYGLRLPDDDELAALASDFEVVRLWETERQPSAAAC